MKNLRSLFTGLVAAVLISFWIAPSISAQDLDDQTPNAVQLEQFRADLSQMITNLNASLIKIKQNPAARAAISKSGKDSVKTSAAARRELEQMSYQELEQVYRAFNTHFPQWRKTSGVMERMAKKIEGNYSEGEGGVTTSNAITPDNCQDAFNAAPSFTDWSAASAAAIAADGLQNVIPPPLNAIATAVYIAAAEGALVAETLNSIFDRCSGDVALGNLQTSVDNIQSSQTDIINNANTNKTMLTTAITNAKTDIITNDNSNKTMLTTTITNAQTSINNTTNSSSTAITTAITNAQTAIVNNDNSNKTMIVNNDNSNALTLNTNLTNAKNQIITNDNTNTTNIVNNDNANKTTIINNDNANTTTLLNSGNANTLALSDLVLRSQIEADLATESNGVKVAWYMTPTANGGKLDLVKQIVTLTLANIVAAGGSIGNAQSFLTQANADKAAGNIKSAYDNYRKAYKAAVN